MKFEVETNQVKAMAESYQETLSQISSGRAKLYEVMAQLDGMWQGQAHNAFAAEYMADTERLGDLLTQLQRVGENISDARISYDTCEQEVKSIIQAIEI